MFPLLTARLASYALQTLLLNVIVFLTVPCVSCRKWRGTDVAVKIIMVGGMRVASKVSLHAFCWSMVCSK